jgi:hypothetical protein
MPTPLADELRRLRTAANLTVGELAARADVRPELLVDIEDGRWDPSPDLVARTGKALDEYGNASETLSRLMASSETSTLHDIAQTRSRSVSRALFTILAVIIIAGVALLGWRTRQQGQRDRALVGWRAIEGECARSLRVYGESVRAYDLMLKAGADSEEHAALRAQVQGSLPDFLEHRRAAINAAVALYRNNRAFADAVDHAFANEPKAPAANVNYCNPEVIARIRWTLGVTQ